MKILAVDTATRSCSVALAEDDRLLAEFTLVRRQTHSRHLAGLIDGLLQSCGVPAESVDGFAVTCGPGSFTGLRIGMSAVKGLAEAIGRPVAGVSTLEVLALQAGPRSALICPVIDARRKEVYIGAYRIQTNLPSVVIAAQTSRPESVPGIIAEPCIYLGDGALLYRDRLLAAGKGDEVLAPGAAHIIRAAGVATLAREKFLAGGGQEAASLVPIYLRKSDAEQNRRRGAIDKIPNIH